MSDTFLHTTTYNGFGEESVTALEALSILTENGFDVCEFNASEIRNQKQIKEQINEINGNVNVIDFSASEPFQPGIIS